MWSIVFAIITTAFLGSCSTTGQVFVSHPQVFTRERLVEERFRESEWARSQLSQDNFKHVHSVNSGLRDFRQFVGVANTLSVAVSPPAQAGSGGASASPAVQHAAIPAPDSYLDSEIRESKAQIDAVKEFEFKQAVRNKVNAAIRQVQLDDTHDLQGATLYSLQFLISVEPGQSSSEFAVVELRVRPPELEICSYKSSDRGFVELYARWLKAYSQDERIAYRGVRNVGVEISNDEQGRESLWWKICGDSSASDDYYVAYVQPSEYAQKVSDVLAREDFGRYVTSLQGMVPNTPIHASETLEVVSRATELAHAATLQPLLVGVSNGRDRFGWIVGPRFAIENGGAVWKHTPTQYDVSAAISVPAWWPYVIVEGRVGWRDRDGTTNWNRTPWYRSPVLSGLRDNTEADHSFEVKDGDSRVDADARDWLYFLRPRAPLWGGRLKVRLPGDMTSLTTRLLAEDDQTLIKPRIKSCERGRTSCYFLTATMCSGDRSMPSSTAEGRVRMPQSLYIRGSELWRNAQVYVGSQRANRVDILPDMGGVVAYFDEVVFVPRGGGQGHQRELQDLRIVTSVDEDILPSAVEVELRRSCNP